MRRDAKWGRCQHAARAGILQPAGARQRRGGSILHLHVQTAVMYSYPPSPARPCLACSRGREGPGDDRHRTGQDGEQVNGTGRVRCVYRTSGRESKNQRISRTTTECGEAASRLGGRRQGVGGPLGPLGPLGRNITAFHRPNCPRVNFGRHVPLAARLRVSLVLGLCSGTQTPCPPPGFRSVPGL